ncbi:hypothetical protein QNM99_15065, partial [Pseudomonas sp. PCH446]
VGFVRERLGRALKWIEGDQTFLADPRDLPLRRYGKGIYTALDSRRQPSLDLSSTESFYQAFAASLSTQEQACWAWPRCLTGRRCAMPSAHIWGTAALRRQCRPGA